MEENTKRVGRKPGVRYATSFSMVRVTFEGEEDKAEILEYVATAFKGDPIGRVFRNIVKEHMEKAKRKAKKNANRG